jgi:tetratricopeptide (TPR) repeat protein
MSLNKSKALRTAEKYVLQGKIPAAIDEYRKVVDADPSDLTTINTLGDLYVRAGRIQDAIANFSRIAESYREGGFTLKAIAMLKKVSKLDPTNIETAMKLANLYSQQGLLVEARQQYLQVADAYARAGQTRKALEAYQKIADLDPANTSVRMKLGDIYAREGMVQQAHDALIMAGAEFLRKGDLEQALDANLKAISVNPESRQALTAIASIYTQRGQADRAINILCDAFEANPGDVELLTILGRTYLSAGFMDDAERTFLSLVELDRNRYNYVLEVGRRFLQLGDLERAAEQIDGCLDILIAKREEDKAIDFLRRILDRDMNHLGSLKRLAEIFLRIREDHNLIATLNSLAEAAMRKGDENEAIAALKELARLDPDEPMHLQRLYNLGVRDIVEPDSPDVIRATGPLDYESAAFDDAFVIRQISEAEILAGHGQVDHAVAMLQEILNHAPENVQVHLKLKDIYLRAGKMEKAANECLDLARIHEARGESARASDFVAEAHQLNPLLEPSAGEHREEPSWAGYQEKGFGFDSDSHVDDTVLKPDRSFGVIEGTGAIDLSKYETGELNEIAGLVTLPPGETSLNKAAAKEFANDGNLPSSPFSFSGALVEESDDKSQVEAQVADTMFSSAVELPSDTMSSTLRDELEGIDFYIAQGYFEIARDTLDRLREEHGEHAEIVSRYRKLAGSSDLPPVADTGELDSNLVAEAQTEFTAPDYSVPISTNGKGHSASGPIVLSGDDESEDESGHGDFTVNVQSSPKEGERKNVLPFLVTKESGQLNPDLLVHFNTSELLNNTDFESLRAKTGALLEQDSAVAPPVVSSGSGSGPISGALSQSERVGTSELIESFMTGISESFDTDETVDETAVEEVSDGEAEFASVEDESVQEEISVQEEFVSEEVYESIAETVEERVEETVEVEGSPVEVQREQQEEFQPVEHVETELQQMLEDLKGNTGDLKQMIDYETHYNLGLAYKDMDLLDEAIEQFQMAFKMAAVSDVEGSYIQCCHMLGVCFKLKKMPKVAVMWFQRGLRVPSRAEDEYQALRYEIGLCYEELGDVEKAIDMLMEVFGIDVNYRSVGEKIKELQALKNA